MRSVVHFHDQCGVAKNLCSIGNLRGETWVRVPRVWEFRNLPPLVSFAYGAGAEVLSRFAAHSMGSLLHIHGGHLTGISRRTSLDYVLHLHGSEVRGFDNSGTPFFSATDETIDAINRAKAVAYSTPDLAPFVLPLRRDAVWIPTPLDRTQKKIEVRNSAFAEVFFPHAWNSSKGIDAVEELVDSLSASIGRAPKLVGLRLGERQEKARSMGFELVETVARTKHIRRMKSSRIVLGQGLGLIGATDLEAMVHGANYLPFDMDGIAMLHYGLKPDDWQSWGQPKTKLKFADLLRNKSITLEGSPYSAVLSKHSDEFVYGQLETLYGGL